MKTAFRKYLLQSRRFLQEMTALLQQTLMPSAHQPAVQTIRISARRSSR